METFEFKTETFIETLMKKMEMGNAPEDVQKSTALEIEKGMSYVIMKTIQENINDNDWKEIIKESKNNIEIEKIMQNIINNKEEVQEALMEKLDQFYNETLEAYSAFKK